MPSYPISAFLSPDEWALCFALSAATKAAEDGAEPLPTHGHELLAAVRRLAEVGFEFEHLVVSPEGRIAPVGEPLHPENLRNYLRLAAGTLGYDDIFRQAIAVAEERRLPAEVRELLREALAEIDQAVREVVVQAAELAATERGGVN